MDILRVLSTPDLEVRKKTLQLALDLVSSRNVEEVSHSVSGLLLILSEVSIKGGEKEELCCKSDVFFSPPAVGDCFEKGGDQDKQRHRT